MIRRVWNLFFNWRKFRIGRHEFVLDIGSGNNPCFRADVICDKYPVESSQRAGLRGVKIYPHQKFVVGDIQSLPFKSKSFDFIVCRHLLEHLEDPGRGIEELMRVGRRGYIETPSTVMEIVYGWPFHKWLVEFREGKMVFTKKSEDRPGGVLPDRIKKIRGFDGLVQKNPEVFLVRYRWQDRIDYRVELSGEVSSHAPEINPDFQPPAEPEPLSTFSTWIKNLFLYSARLSWVKRRVSLSDILACPVCKDETGLRQEGKKFVCQKCRRSYQIWNGIPVILPE